MNDGLSMLGNSKWVVFWGSDDFASSPDSLSAVHDIVIDHPTLILLVSDAIILMIWADS